MKNIFKYIAFGIAFLAFSFALNAQESDPYNTNGTYNKEGGMATSKKVTGPENGYYTVSLESFATGKTTLVENATPVDIVLVLDVSGSMEEYLDQYTYTALSSQGWSYSSYGYSTYYYKHTDGEYYQVSRTMEYDGSGSQSSWGNYYTRLSYSVDGITYYLSGETTTTTPPTNVKGNNATIWTGILYDYGRQTKMDALKSAVRTFVDAVNHNANFDSKGQERKTILHNRISVVKYASNVYCKGENEGGNTIEGLYYDDITPGNHDFIGGYNWGQPYYYNYTEVLVGFTDVSTNDGVTKVMGDGTYVGVTDLQPGGATASDFGMTKAKYLLESVKGDDSNKVVVLFTDGSPTYGNSFSNDVANNTIDVAKTLKSTDDGGYGATVFTIGVFDSETSNIKTYMNNTSSNYPNAESMTNAGTDGGDNGYYQNASGANLDEIFKAVAEASGASDATAGASTEVRDVVSNSFIMPEGDAAQITIKVSTISRDGKSWSAPETAEGVTSSVKTVTTTTGEEHKELVVSGFDYTKADKMEGGFTTEDGNWVGKRYSDETTSYWAGKKLIITFKIKANENATGGDGTATNHPDSGIYVQQFNEDGTPKTNPDGSFVFSKVNQYAVPHTPLPLLIKITKDGLRTGESATFQLFRIRPLIDVVKDKEGNVIKSKVDPTKDSVAVVYNAIGKPEPGIHEFNARPWWVDRTQPDPKPNKKDLVQSDPMDYLEGIGWDDWSKVVLTNKGDDGDNIEKVLYGLDPGWVYMVVEDDWGWAYKLTGTVENLTTSDYELNPFEFHNEARTVNLEGNPIVKHAEAVTINHFNTKDNAGYKEEHYKSSKKNYNSK